jgi:hypothetical protein
MGLLQGENQVQTLQSAWDPFLLQRFSTLNAGFFPGASSSTGGNPCYFGYIDAGSSDLNGVFC